MKKTEKKRVAFDLDGVIIDKPPIIPKKMLECLFRGKGKGSSLHYRFPSTKLEQGIRKLSHYYLFRPPIEESLRVIRKMAKEEKFDFFIVSARYSFLEKETQKWLEKRGINGLFQKVYLNIDNEQPHLFKEKKLKDLKADVFIDDDNLLADYLADSLSNIKIYCLSSANHHSARAKNVSFLEEAFK